MYVYMYICIHDAESVFAASHCTCLRLHQILTTKIWPSKLDYQS